MKHKKQFQMKYVFVDYVQKERQKRLDDIFNYIFDELDILDMEHIDKKDEYEHPVVIQK